MEECRAFCPLTQLLTLFSLNGEMTPKDNVGSETEVTAALIISLLFIFLDKFSFRF